MIDAMNNNDKSFISDHTANAFLMFLCCLIVFVLGAGFMTKCQKDKEHDSRVKRCTKLGGALVQRQDGMFVCYRESSLIEVP